MPHWIRGVNLGGWLLLERWITPYLFALTSCHLEGNFCSYPGQSEGDLNEDYCDLYHCKPLSNFPTTEFELKEKFNSEEIASQYLHQHYNTFVSHEEISKLKEAGVQYVRVPIHNNIATEETWLYLVRLVSWCRMDGLQVWISVQNVEQEEDDTLCALEGLETILKSIHRDGLGDVVTGIGLDTSECEEEAVTLVHKILGKDTAVLLGGASENDGIPNNNNNTYLETRYNHVFKAPLSPRQCIGHVCQHTPNVTHGIVSDWSASFYNSSEILENVLLLMEGIRHNGTARPYRKLTKPKQHFLKHYVKAQMVAFEASETRGWFFGNFKVEGGALLEHDFLRGVKDGWIPTLPPSNMSAADYFDTTCQDIMFQQDDDWSITDPFSKHAEEQNFDVVASHGDSLLKSNKKKDEKATAVVGKFVGNDLNDDDEYHYNDDDDDDDTTIDDNDDESTDNDDDESTDDDSTETKHATKKKGGGMGGFFSLATLAFFAFAIKRVFFSEGEQRPGRSGYMSVDSPEALTMAV